MDLLHPANKPSRRRAKIIYGFILIMHFMLSIDTTSIAVALPVCVPTAVLWSGH